MNLDHLTYFKTLVELGSRSETAERLSITPSTLSLALSKLEQEVGVPLIQKKRGSVELTSEGETFYEYVETSLRFLNNGLKLLQEKRGGCSYSSVKGDSPFRWAFLAMLTQALPDLRSLPAVRPRTEPCPS